jgi:hypothetical protein
MAEKIMRWFFSGKRHGKPAAEQSKVCALLNRPVIETAFFP